MVTTEHNLYHILEIMKAHIMLIARYIEIFATRRQEMVKFFEIIAKNCINDGAEFDWDKKTCCIRLINKTSSNLIIVTKVLAGYKQSRYYVFLTLPYLKKLA